MVDFLLKILPGIIIAIFASYLSAKWSLKKFYSEKWWERKERAYAEIIDALYDLVQFCEIKKEDYGQGTGYSEKRETEFRKRYNQAYWKIKKQKTRTNRQDVKQRQSRCDRGAEISD